MSIELSKFISVAIGAFVGSSLTLLAAYLSHCWQVSIQNKKDDKAIKSLLQAIHDEIETLWELYMQGAGNKLEALEKNKPLNFYYPVTQDYFTVHTSNADSIGSINDNDLRKLIVTTYSTARGLIDSYRLNNDLVQKHESAYWIFKETNSQFHEQMAFGHYKALVSYADVLRADHDNLKVKVTELLRALRKQGVLWEEEH
jgi:hypothetical protein